MTNQSSNSDNPNPFGGESLSYEQAASLIMPSLEDDYGDEQSQEKSLRQRDDSEPADQEEPIAEDAEVEAAETEETKETDEAEIQSLDDLVQALEWGEDATALNNLKLRQKVNGAMRETTLGEALEVYRKNTAADDRLEDAKRQSGELAAHRERLETEHASRMQELQSTIQVVESQILGDIDKVKELEQDDPQEYIQQRWKIEDRARKLQEAKNQLVQQHTRLVEEARDKAKKTISNLIPEWSSPSTMRAESEQIDKYLLGMGFSSSEVSNFIDPRAIALVRKAWMHDQVKTKAAKVKERVKPSLRLARPSAPQSKKQAKSLKVSEQLQKLRKTGDRNLARQIIKESLLK